MTIISKQYSYEILRNHTIAIEPSFEIFFQLEHTLDGLDFTGDSSSLIVFISAYGIFALFLFTFIIVLYVVFYRKLRKIKTLSESAYQVNMMFFNALKIQTILICILWVIPVFYLYLFVALRVETSYFISFGFIPFLFDSMFECLCNLYFIQPFKNGVKTFFKWKSNSVIETVTTF